MGLEQKELQKFMAEKAGIGFSSGTDFGELGEGFMRMNIATPRKNVMKAMKQLAAAIKG
jgi:cystathionine beta-lyase